MSPLPTEMVDRWYDRQEPRPGRGTVYWHILVGDDPEVRGVAQSAQARLAHFSGLHLTPLQWLHITMHVAGSTEEITDGQQQDMHACASDLLAHIPPMEVTLGRIIYHPEAIAVAVQPGNLWSRYGKPSKPPRSKSPTANHMRTAGGPPM